MIQALLVIAVVEGVAIGFLIKALIRKREKQIIDYNENIVSREKEEQQIKEKYKDKEGKLEEDAKKAKDAHDFLDIISRD